VAKARKIDEISRKSEYRYAIGRLIETRFDEMMLHRAGTLSGRDPEDLHDMRVASRRLRAAMDVAVECFPARFRYFHSTIKELTDVLGGVRDYDVLRIALVEYRDSRPASERPAINAMLQTCRVEREVGRERLIEFFDRLERERFDVRFRGFIAEHTIG
jgi:CHAD domain-containing protein